MGGYEHYWSDRLSSNAVYSVASAPDEDYYADTFNKDLDYGAVNLLYWFLPDRAWAGVEYLYGRREVFGGEVGSGRSASVRGSLQPPVVATMGSVTAARRLRFRWIASISDRRLAGARTADARRRVRRAGGEHREGPAAGEWRTFGGNWTASGTRTTLDLGSDHRRRSST